MRLPAMTASVDSSATSSQDLAVHVGPLAPRARRRPISRVRRVTFCQSTPVSPRADHRDQEERR